MKRVLQPELLDELPPSDPRAIHSRRDLRLINWIMQNPHYIAEFLNRQRDQLGEKWTFSEIGSGDGNVAMEIATRLSKANVHGRTIMVDRQHAIDKAVLAGFDKSRWSAEFIGMDVFAWLATKPKVDVVIANLFLHHFSADQLQLLFEGIAKNARVFVACEPWRNRFAPWFARQVWLIGCNDVTCNDAEISVRAGFREKELSALWPQQSGWDLTERRAGIFTHFFAAVRKK